MKSMPQEARDKGKTASRRSAGRGRLPEYPREVQRNGEHGYHRDWHPVKSKKKRKKKRKPMFRRLVEEIWDEVEDIFD